MKVYSSFKNYMNSPNSVFSLRKKLLSEVTGLNLDNIDSKYNFNYGKTSLPHMEKRSKGGEDASFASNVLLSVADGVGGWSELGIDPGIFSRQLIDNISNENTRTNNRTNILDLFVKACENNKHKGSSTCTICRLNYEKTSNLETLNLGDSGYIILRPQLENIESQNDLEKKELNKKSTVNVDVVYKSEEQTHGFNFPFQVGTDGDNPRKAMLNTHKLKEFDIVIVATDGLWDNLNNEQLVTILKKYYSTHNIDSENENLNNKSLINPQKLSEIITYTAEYVSLDKNYMSPFALRSNNLYVGGKHDDITVVVAQLLKEKTPKF